MKSTNIIFIPFSECRVHVYASRKIMIIADVKLIKKFVENFNEKTRQQE